MDRPDLKAARKLAKETDDPFYFEMMQRIADEMDRLQRMMPPELQSPNAEQLKLLRVAAERNVVSYYEAERARADARTKRQMQIRLVELGKQVEALRKRKTKQRGRTGQVSDAVEELSALGMDPSRKAVAQWIGVHVSRLSKEPLKGAYMKALEGERLKAAAPRTKAKRWHDAVNERASDT